MKLTACKWEVKAALLLSDLAYNIQPVDTEPNSALRTFKEEFSEDICSFCTLSGQKYVIAICEKDGSRVLFCSFAGSHLEGDWENTNLDIAHTVNEEEVGVSVHQGFENRSKSIPLEGVKRIALQNEVSQIVFCGHSLGGAVAHITRLRWLFGYVASNRDEFGKDNVISIGIGAPFFGGSDLRRHLQKHDGWFDGFITVVNGDDPIPRIMNLATAVDQISGHITRLMISTCISYLTNPSQALHEKLLIQLQKTKKKQTDYLKLYCPVGQYLLFDTDGNAEVKKDVDTLTMRLGAAQLFQKSPSLLKGVINHDSLAHHHINAYRKIMEESANNGAQLYANSFPQSNTLTNIQKIEPKCLLPEIHHLMCETFTSHSKQANRIIKIIGKNLDFVELNGVDIDKDNFDPMWSSTVRKDNILTRRSEGELIISQEINPNLKRNGKIVSRPNGDVKVLVVSQIVAETTGPAQVEDVLSPDRCADPLTISGDEVSFYGGQFFLDTQQHCWILKEKCNNRSLEEKMKTLKRLVKKHCNIPDSVFLDMNRGWRKLEDVGFPMSDGNQRVDNGLYRTFRNDLFKWIVPPNGLPIQSTVQQVTGLTIIAGSLLLGGGIISVGGLGVVGGLIGVGGSATGGYGTAWLIGSAGFVIAECLKSRASSEYCTMLRDMIKVYTGRTQESLPEMDLERVLVQAANNYHEFRSSGRLSNTRQKGITVFHECTIESQRKIQERVELIEVINDIKKERLKLKVVSVCGPRDSGKTTLVSQLLHDPKLALKAGFRGGEEETKSVTVYNFQDVSNHVILDTPGLTGTNRIIRDKFSKSALNLSSTFIYIRPYEGLPTEIDVETVSTILNFAANSEKAKILICLNSCVGILTEDAIDERWDLIAADLKKQWFE